MGRRKIEIKAIKDDRNRSVTFLKRKGGLFKKAHELSVLCSVDVAVFIFGSNKKLYEYSSCNMRDLITRYSYHGGPNEHKGPSDFSGGGDDEDDEDGEATPPHGEGIESHMLPPHFQNQPPFPQVRHHTPSASPPVPPGVFGQQPGHPGHPVPRGHTPQPPMGGSRPSSRNDMGRLPPNMGHPPVGPPGPPHQPPVNGYAFMPQPAIYNPQSNNGPHGLPAPQQGQFPYPPPQPAHAHQMGAYMEEQRRSSLPPVFPSSGPQQPPTIVLRHSVSPPQPPPQHLPLHSAPHPSPPPPQARPMPSQPQPQAQSQQQSQSQSQSQPQQHPHLPPPPPPPPQQQHQSQSQQQNHQPPAPMELKPESLAERPPQPPLLDTGVKRLPPRKGGSIFTPIEPSGSMLDRHFRVFNDAESSIKQELANRSQSLEVPGGVRPRPPPSPPLPQRANTIAHAKNRTVSVSSIPETTFTPPSRSNSLRVGGAGGARPRLKVQIPAETSDGSATAESGSPRGASDTTSHSTRRNASDSHSSGVVLPPPSPSASALLSAGASGPPNPFARPPPQQHQPTNMSIDNTPVSALPSRFLNNEFLPSPSSFLADWNFRGNDSNTLPSPLNFATPVVGTGPSFLRDDSTPNKRKSPEMSAGPPHEPADMAHEPKRVKVDS